MAKAASPAKKAPSKSEVTNNIAEATSLSKKQVGSVLEALANEIKKSLSNKGPGVFAVPGLVKIEKKKVPARPVQGRPQPLQARRTDGSTGQAGQREGQGSRVEEPQRHGLTPSTDRTVIQSGRPAKRVSGKPSVCVNESGRAAC